jgi:hypothetical protein
MLLAALWLRALLLRLQLLYLHSNSLQPLHRLPLQHCHRSTSASCLQPLLLLLL